MTAPDRIWCHPTERQPVPAKDKKHSKWVRGNWKDHNSNAHGDVEFVRLDPVVLAALPEVQALILAERERCAKVAEDAAPVTQDMNHTQIADACYRIATAIRKGDDHE